MNERITMPEANAAVDRLEIVRDQMTREMGVTKGCRFNAAKRLETLEKRRTITIAGASIFVIVLSLIPAMVPVPQLLSNLLTLITVGFSIIILVASILQSANSDSVKADQLHRCSLDINAIRQELRTAENLDGEILKLFSKRYQDVLQRYSVNHDDIDYEKYKLDHPDDYPKLTPKEKTASIKIVGREDILSTIAGFLSAIAAVVAAMAFSYEAVSKPVFEFIRRLLGP